MLSDFSTLIHHTTESINNYKMKYCHSKFHLLSKNSKFIVIIEVYTFYNFPNQKLMTKIPKEHNLNILLLFRNQFVPLAPE